MTEEGFSEDAIFKSLNHGIRREIIKTVGGKKSMAFSEINKALVSVDSPTLSYHLKSMQALLEQDESKYKLSEVGKAAFALLGKTDESRRLARGKKGLKRAYLIVIFSWLVAINLAAIIIFTDIPLWIRITVYHVVMNAGYAISNISLSKLLKSL